MRVIIALICSLLIKFARGELLTSYSFLRANCLTSLVPNEGVLSNNSLRSTNTIWHCPRSNGLLSTSFASSTDDLRQIQSSLQNKAFSFELWLAPASGLGSHDTLKVANLGGTSYSGDKCEGGLLQLSQIGVSDPENFQLELFLCSAAPTTNSKSALLDSPVYNLSKSINGEVAIIHLVINMEFVQIQVDSTLYYQTSANFVLNGMVGDMGYSDALLQVPLDATTWDASNPLEIFPTGSSISAEVNNMVLYYFGLRNQTLSDHQIQIQYNNSIPLSEPVTYSTNVSVLENGQVRDESMNPAFFTRNVSSTELPIIEFGLFNLNQDPISPNYALGNAIKSQVYLISFLPRSYGELYFLNGSIFDNSDTLQVPWNNTLSSYALRYRPPYNTYSSFRPTVDIEFYAKDKLTNSTSSVATLSVFVERVIKPPVATPTVVSRVFLARRFYTIQLTGASNSGQHIVSANITLLPQHGKLYMTRDNGSLQMLSNHSENKVYLKTGQINVVYMFTGKENGSEIVTDYFSFLVQDNSGLFSLPANISISAITSLTAISNVYTVEEDVPTMIQIDGTDAAATPRNLRAILRSQPALGGQVLNSTSLSPYHVGEAFVGVIYAEGTNNTGGSGIQVRYLSPPKYFTTPNVTVTGRPLRLPQDSFNIQITDDSMTAYSAWASQSLIIQNVNNPTTIVRNSLNTNFTIQKYSGNDIESSILTLYNFTVIDPDLDTNFIRVSITVNIGFLSLSPDALSDIDFNSITYCQENGHLVCKGDGSSNSEMLFVASPSALGEAINGMTYYSTRGNIYDTITITIYDGAGGACLNRTLLDPITIFDGCFTTSFRLHVHVQNAAAIDGSLNGNISQQFLSTNLKYLLLGFIVLMLIILLRWCCVGRSRQQKTRRAKQSEKMSPAATPERHTKQSKRPRTNTSPVAAAIVESDNDDEEAVVGHQKNTMQQQPLDHYPKMISLADITTPPRRTKLITPPSSSRSKKASTEVRLQSVTDSDTKTKSAKTWRKSAASTTASSTPTRVNSLASKSSRLRRDSLSATTHDLGATASASSSHIAADSTYVLGGSLQTATVPASTAGAPETGNDAATCIWTAHRHSSGRTYYYNKRTKKSVWAKPESFV